MEMEGISLGENVKINGAKMIKSSNIGSPQRKKLADISNLNQKLVFQKQDSKRQPSLLMTNDYVEKLHKENMTLMKLLAERNHIIEISGTELQKMRTNFQKLQRQNLQLAQANSQMLAELNSVKDRLKALQHELGCKNGILISRKLDQESKEAETCQTGEVGTSECDGADESMHANKDNKLCKTNRRRQSKRESFGPSVVQPDLPKVEVKRPCLRRKSAKLKTEEPVSKEDEFDIENTNCGPSVVQPDLPKVEAKRPCLRRKSAKFKTEEPVCKEDKFDKENTNFGPSVAQPDLPKVGGKRPCLRRQSANFKSEEPVAKEDEFDIENTNFGPSVVQPDILKVEVKRPCLRRQSAKFKSKEPVAKEDEFDMENTNFGHSVVQPDIPKVEVKRPCLRRQSAKFNSEEPVAKEDEFGIENTNFGPSVVQPDYYAKIEVKRPCLRTQSAEFKTEEPVAKEDKLDIANTNFTAASQCTEIVSASTFSTVKREDDGNATNTFESQECRRSSVGRPLRRAAEKIQSYKEISINIKMRRTE